MRTAGERLGLDDLEVAVRVLTSEAEAVGVPFAGSPTILVDGRDPFPSSGTTTELACRIYRTESGFAGTPSVDQLIQVLGERR